MGHCGDEHCDECNRVNGIVTDADRVRELEAKVAALEAALRQIRDLPVLNTAAKAIAIEALEDGDA